MAILPDGAVRVPADLAPLLEHSVLRPEATALEVRRACAEAREHRLGAVCVRPAWVREVRRELAGSGVKVVAVVDFPEGQAGTAERAREARTVVAGGAEEVDVVLPLALLRAKDYRGLLRDLGEVVAAGAPVKVILETCRLSREEKAIAAALSKGAGAAWVKTSTGFAEGGATEEDVALLRSVVGTEFGVKASGGVRTAGDALRMVRAGADRVGTSASVAILAGCF
ncbi:MAG TPA: deoxyribose-phosphate aldolase [Anaeromyxobacteraceae bacterium]|nr:deoxyribose-phosphate aldolase [Anaeromyxobacteraceae bacterium]